MTEWPDVHLSRYIELDPDRIADVASGCEAVIVNRLDAGNRPSLVRQVRSRDFWALDIPEFYCKLHAEAGLDPDCLVVIFVVRAAGSFMCGIPLEDGMVITFPPGMAITAAVRPGLIYSGAVMAQSHWYKAQKVATGIVGELRVDHPVIVKLGDAQAQTLLRILRRTASLLGCQRNRSLPALAPPNVYFEFVDALAEATAHADGRYEAIDRNLPTLGRLAFCAVAYIHDHMAERIPVRALCEEMNISRRQLEYAFRSTFDMGPFEFAYRLRLNAARRDLLAGKSSGITATAAAFDHGINHLGRFASNYRRLFGELPSDTLRHGNISPLPGVG